MAQNDLRINVKVNTNDAEAKLKRLQQRLNQFNDKFNRLGSGGGKFTTHIQNATNKMKELDQTTKKTGNSMGTLTKKVRQLASAYMGIMGAKALINTSDIITSAENRLNNLEGANPKQTAQTMDKIYAASQRARTGYTDMMSNVSKTMTLAGDAFQDNIDNAIKFQEIMAKSYTVGGASAAEQASSMYQLVQALGSGILQGDELRSVREGAPIAYKEIEKFAQGVLNTKESLKELASQGKITSDMVVAAIMNAEQKINDSFNNTQMTFAQAWENIKNMAVKAFEPVFQMLNNALNSDAGKAIINGIGQALIWLADIILWVGNIFGVFFNWCAENWYWLQWIVLAVAILIAGHLTMLALKAVWAGIMMFYSFLTGLSPLQWAIIIIGIVVAAIVWLANTTASACEFMFGALMIVALGILIIGIITGSTALMIASIVVALVAILLYLFMNFGSQIVGIAYWVVTALFNVASFITSFIAGCVMALLAIIHNVIAFIINLVMGVAGVIVAICHNVVAGIINLANGLFNVISAVTQNIGIAFSNAFYGALGAFWDFIADCMEGLDWLAKPLEKIAELFGKNFDAGGFTASLRSKAEGAYGKQKDFVNVGNAFSSGMNTVAYKDIGNSWSSGWNTTNFANIGDAWSKGWNISERKSLSDAYNTGAAKGAVWQNDLNSWVGSVQDKIAGFGVSDLLGGWDALKNFKVGQFSAGSGTLNPTLGNLGKILGTDDGGKGGSGRKLPGANDPSTKLGSYDPSKVLDGIKDAVGDTAGNTGKIADSMDLTQEDLEYLRKIADMEWKKEFTTASITVDMSNYNTFNGESDLDGIVTKLTDRLYEELDSVANGVYA